MSIAKKWPLVKLGDHVDLVTGYPFKSAGYVDDPEGVRLIRGANVSQERLVWDDTKRWSVTDMEAYENYQLKVGDVILAMDRPWIQAGLKQAVVTTRDLPALLVQRVARLRGKNGLRTRYLRYLVASSAFSEYIEPIVTGVNVPHISTAQIEGFRFFLPPLETQDEVIAVLYPYDELVLNNLRRIEILEEMAQGIYHEWFVNFRFPGQHPVASRIELDEVAFSDVAQFINGFAFKPTIHWQDSGLPIVKIKELKNGVTDETPRYHGRDVPKKNHIDDGALLFSWSADLSAYLWEGGPALLNQHIFDVTPHEGLDREFLYHALLNRMDYFRSRAQGTTMRHIKRSALSEVRMILPDKDLRDLFVEHVRPIHVLRRNLRQQTNILEGTREVLLERLISGEMDVSALEIDTSWLAA